MPNQHGGKAYKKGSKKKVQQQSENAKRFNGRDEGQDYARVTRMLGNRRTLCFCNDGIERVGKIRGALCKGPKRQKIEVGDIVVVSLRSFDTPDSDSDDEEEGGGDVITHVTIGRKEVVDILDKVAPAHWRQVRKEAGIHKDLFPGTGGQEDDIFEEKTDEGEEKEAESDIDIDDI
jgi:initiation factor 1A